MCTVSWNLFDLCRIACVQCKTRESIFFPSNLHMYCTVCAVLAQKKIYILNVLAVFVKMPIDASKLTDRICICLAPCVPQGETANLDCVTNSAWVTWLQAKGAESYSVLAVERGGTNSSCSAADLQCNVPDLLCGATYTFHITAVNSFCRSPPGNAFQIQTGANTQTFLFSILKCGLAFCHHSHWSLSFLSVAPCALTSITAHTDCYSSHITVNWQLNEGSSFYVATAEGHDQSILICNSTGTSCDLSGAKCGMQYTILISASSDKCSSLRSPPLKMHTGTQHDTNLSRQGTLHMCEILELHVLGIIHTHLEYNLSFKFSYSTLRSSEYNSEPSVWLKWHDGSMVTFSGCWVILTYSQQ